MDAGLSGTKSVTPLRAAVISCLATALVFVVGFHFGSRGEQRATWNLPSIPISATATHGTKNLVIATGEVSEQIEGFFALDGMSGDLQCTAFNPTSRTFSTAFRRNVLADLQLDAAKSPEFLMVTGQVLGMRRTAQQIGSSLVYVVEAGSGKYAVYAIPWRRDLFNSGRPQQGELLLLQAGSIRTAAIRE